MPTSTLYIRQFFTFGFEKKGLLSQDILDWLYTNSKWITFKKYLETSHSGHIQSLKVHKHVIILNFFLAKSNPYMTLVNFRKKNLLLFLRFSPEFRSLNIFTVTEHTQNQICLKRHSKIIFFKMYTWVLFRWVPKQFF